METAGGGRLAPGDRARRVAHRLRPSATDPAAACGARRTQFGRHVFAGGGHPEAARRAGISVTRTRALVFVMSGTFAAAGGSMSASRLLAVSSGAGSTRLLAIAARSSAARASSAGGERSTPRFSGPRPRLGGERHRPARPVPGLRVHDHRGGPPRGGHRRRHRPARPPDIGPLTHVGRRAGRAGR